MKLAGLTLALLIAALPAESALAGGIPLERRVGDLFAPCFRKPSIGDRTDWTRPVYSAKLTQLIAAWRRTVSARRFRSSLDQDGWFCPYQDWDGARFRVLGRSIRPLSDGQVEADVRFNLVDGGAALDTRLIMARQGERWKVADLFSDTLPLGLAAALRAEIAAGGSAK